jgi:CRP-like cAMP-binding protein
VSDLPATMPLPSLWDVRNMSVSVSTEAWSRLVLAGSARRHEPGAVLLRQGGLATHVLALVVGRVKVVRTSSDGDVLVLADYPLARSDLLA